MVPPVVAGERPTGLVILGHPVTHSLSPIFQQAALDHLGLPLRYERLDVPAEQLVQTLERLAHEGIAGNVTIPHKEAVAARARCTPLAARVGAVNTFWHERGVLMGHNTDVAGVMAAMAQVFPAPLAGEAVAVLGAGGSAAAALVALEQLGCREMRVVARTPARAMALVERLGIAARVETDTHTAVRDVAMVINCTPIGLADDAMPVEPARLPARSAVLDLVYRRGETAWVRACRSAGHAAADGVHMLLEQGAAAFECWFGVQAPRDVMRNALLAAAR